MRIKGYYRHIPETEHTRESTEFLTFRACHAQEAHTVLLEEGIPELDALKLVNKWNRIADLYRYWLD